MRLRVLVTSLVTVGVVLVSGSGPAPSQDLSEPPSRPSDRNNPGSMEPEVLTRGPLHEAYAMPYSSDTVPGDIVRRQPPEPINEVPPEIRPEGVNVEWIPGYWAWEPAEQDFIWISGVWRNMPPDQTWVPGYWTEVDGGFQWVSGFWTSAEVQQVDYLPYPPESVEQGPNSPAPDGDYFWVPGLWVWQDTDYIWRPGYWAPAHENWVWIPTHYTWTPHGCVLVTGYWDYALDRRGMAFAPVYFGRTNFRQGFRHRPSHVVDVMASLTSWFVGPRSHHYYYGDYYGADFARTGLVPWYTHDQRAGWHDPLMTYYQWHYARRDIPFTGRLRSWHRHYAQNESARPAHRFAAQQQRIVQLRAEDRDIGRNQLVRSLEQLTQGDQQSFVRVESRDLERFQQTAQAMREVQQNRNRVEGRQRAGSRTEGRAAARPILDLGRLNAGRRQDRGSEPDGRTDDRRQPPGAGERRPAVPDFRDTRDPTESPRRGRPRGFDSRELQERLERRQAPEPRGDEAIPRFRARPMERGQADRPLGGRPDPFDRQPPGDRGDRSGRGGRPDVDQSRGGPPDADRGRGGPPDADRGREGAADANPGRKGPPEAADRGRGNAENKGKEKAEDKPKQKGSGGGNDKTKDNAKAKGKEQGKEKDKDKDKGKDGG